VASNRSRSSERLVTAARIAVVVAAGYLLIADSAPYEGQTCVHPTEAVAFAVSGSCGPAGTIMLMAIENECGFSVAGGPAVGLPNSGRFEYSAAKGSLLSSPWTLSGDIAPAPRGADGAAPQDAGPGGPAGDAGQSSSDGGRLVTDAGTGPASDGAPYVPPPDGGDEPGFIRRVCKVQLADGGPRRLVCTDGGGSAAGTSCVADLSLL